MGSKYKMKYLVRRLREQRSERKAERKRQEEQAKTTAKLYRFCRDVIRALLSKSRWANQLDELKDIGSKLGKEELARMVYDQMSQDVTIDLWSKQMLEHQLKTSYFFRKGLVNGQDSNG